MNNSILTYHKHSINPLDINPEEIVIEDIAHALSYLARANGHFPYFYSVAQHCINCAKEAAHRGFSPNVQLACLLHDGSESYISDIPRPVKQHLHYYLGIEENIQEAIYHKYGLLSFSGEEREQIALVDDCLLHQEFKVILGEELTKTDNYPVMEHDLGERSFVEVKEEFLTLFAQLINEKSF